MCDFFHPALYIYPGPCVRNTRYTFFIGNICISVNISVYLYICISVYLCICIFSQDGALHNTFSSAISGTCYQVFVHTDSIRMCILMYCTLCNTQCVYMYPHTHTSASFYILLLPTKSKPLWRSAAQYQPASPSIYFQPFTRILRLSQGREDGGAGGEPEEGEADAGESRMQAGRLS